jgi:hypothetical protein
MGPTRLWSVPEVPGLRGRVAAAIRAGRVLRRVRSSRLQGGADGKEARVVTLQDRADAYARMFPQRPPMQVVREQGREVLYGTWLGGQNYRNASTFYGSYPPKYLERVQALFPDVWLHGSTWRTRAILHAFSGSLPDAHYTRCDAVQPAELQCRVEDLPGRVTGRPFHLVMADPPYSADDAKRYATPMVNRRLVLAALAGVTTPGGHLVWLDTTWPMHSKREWRTVGRITLIRSTNHRVRLVSIFERQAS